MRMVLQCRLTKRQTSVGNTVAARMMERRCDGLLHNLCESRRSGVRDKVAILRGDSAIDEHIAAVFVLGRGISQMSILEVPSRRRKSSWNHPKRGLLDDSLSQ